MTNDAKSRFAAFINPKANAENRLPHVSGRFALPGGIAYSFSAWAGRSAKDTLYMKGTHAPLDLSEALKAQINTDTGTSSGPPEIDLKQGEIVLFENRAKHGAAEGESEADKKKRLKRPDWYGYARTADGWYQLAGWAQDTQGKPGFIAGTAARYSPEPAAEPLNAEHTRSKGRRERRLRLAPEA